MAVTNFLGVANFGTGFLVSSVSSTATSLTLQDADMAKFPADFPYRVVVDAEVMEVTAKNDVSNTLAVTRAREGTVATSHLTLALVSVRLTAEGVQRMYNAINDLEESLGTVEIRVDEGMDAGQRERIHFLSGFGIDVVAADDIPNSEVRVTIHNDRTIDTIVGTNPITVAHNIVLVNASGGATTITLPTAVGNTGKRFSIKKIDGTANAVTVQGTGGQTVDGSTISIPAQYDVRTVVSDGANWHVLAN